MESRKEKIQLNECILGNRLTNNDKKNFKIIAAAIDNIVTEISRWVEMSEDNYDSDTCDLGKTLSNLAAQLRGEWNEPVKFKFGFLKNNQIYI